MILLSSANISLRLFQDDMFGKDDSLLNAILSSFSNGRVRVPDDNDCREFMDRSSCCNRGICALLCVKSVPDSRFLDASNCVKDSSQSSAIGNAEN